MVTLLIVSLGALHAGPIGSAVELVFKAEEDSAPYTVHLTRIYIPVVGSDAGEIKVRSSRARTHARTHARRKVRPSQRTRPAHARTPQRNEKPCL